MYIKLNSYFQKENEGEKKRDLIYYTREKDNIYSILKKMKLNIQTLQRQKKNEIEYVQD